MPDKNLSPQQIATYNALPVAALAGIGTFIASQNWAISLGIFFGFLIIVYLLTLYMIRQFIDRKIKLIYKMIYQTKATKKEEFYYKNILPQQSIEEVEGDVEQWAEQRKDEIEQLQQNEIYRKEFLLNLSHELKTPIFAIQGYVDTLANGALHNPDVNIKFLANTARNVDRLVNLINDLDEISSLESGQQIFQQENFIIQDLIKEVFETLSINADEKHIRCQIKKGCEVPVNVYADKEKIRQVIINLVDNAIKYGKENGTIEGSVYRVDGKRILVEISDDGAGITEEHLPRIFERFYRTDLARTRKVGGSGLGLSICKHIIEAHGQAMHVRSKVDVGSSFGFTLQGVRN